MILLRILILFFAGYPLYQDEQERFVCNTIQPGCANVCYDLFSPISLFRFWLVQLFTLCLPYIIFIVYVVHKVSNNLSVDLNPAERGRAQCFTGGYILHLMLRTFLEAGFGAAHYYLFGFYIPRRFLCQHPPCTTQVDCYISRPTEKTVMLNFMLGVAALSLFLNVLDFICAIKRSVTQKSKRKMMLEKMYEEEEEEANDPNTSVVQQDLEVEADQAESFRKRRSSRGLCRAAALPVGNDTPCLERSSSLPCSPGPQGCNTNGNNGSSVSQEETPEKSGSEVALCPPEPMGTPRSIRVSKRSQLKPPPPPRRDPGWSTGPTGDISAICTRRVGQYTLVELSSNVEIQTNDNGQDKRSEWV